MKILSIGNFGNSWDGSMCDEIHVAQALELQGHTVDRLQRELIVNTVPVQKIFPGHGYDFILLAQWDGYPESMIPWLKKDGCPIVYWAFDYQADGQEWHERLIKGCDMYLSKRLADSKYANWRWLPQDFAPEFLRAIYPISEKDIDVLFTGSYVSWGTERIETLKAIDKQFNLRIHSFTPDAWKAEGFKDVHGPVVDEALPELYARAKVNISIDLILEAGYWSDRNAQIMVCGGMVLYRHVPMSEIVFDDKVAYFYSIEDCLRKVDYYLENEFERERLAMVGQDYAYRNLMVDNRVGQLLTLVEAYLA